MRIATADLNELEIHSNYAKEIMIIGSCFKKSPSDTRLLDFGIPVGVITMVNGLGYESYGIELSESRIKYAESKGTKVISWGASRKFTV